MTDADRPPSPLNREVEKRLVWARSAGRCAVCQTLLTEGAITHQEMTVGELAHIVGRQPHEGSPRGIFDLPVEERDRASNLILVCASTHDEIDRDGATDTLTVERLREIKQRHEDWVEHVTGLARERSTAVLRVLGDVRGHNVDVSRSTASDAVIRTDERFPDFPLAYDRHGIEIDLRGLPGELDGSEDYWRTAVAKIDEVVSSKLEPAVHDDRVQHLSIFAFARLPLLVYLGAQIDDTFGVSIYQRNRSTERWEWPSGQDIEFGIRLPETSGVSVEAVLIVNVSGTIQPDEIPAELRAFPTFAVEAVGVTREPDTLRSKEALASFERTVRGLHALMERDHKPIRRLHVLAALPVAAAVAFGRAHDPHVHPTLVVYHRTNSQYQVALELS